MSFKENLRNEISYQDIKMTKLAASLNIPYSTFLTYVNNSGTIPNCEIAVKIAKKLNVSVEYLVTGNDEELKKIRNKKIENQFKEIYPIAEDFIVLKTPVKSLIGKIIHILADYERELEKK